MNNPNIDKRFRLISAVHLFLIKDGKILLLRRYNTGYEDGNYSVVAGHLDGDERATEAMVREAKEEAGIEVNEKDLEMVHAMHRGDLRHKDGERIDFFLKANKWTGEPRIMEEDKADEIRWFNLEEIPENIIPYIASAIKNINNQIFYSEFNWEKE